MVICEFILVKVCFNVENCLKIIDIVVLCCVKVVDVLLELLMIEVIG